MDIYREEVLDHARNPHNLGKISHPDVSVRTSNPLCGDVINLEIAFAGKPPRVARVGFEAEACTISVAAASILTEKMKGKTKKELAEFTADDVVSWLGGSLTPSRTECAVLPLKALRKILLT